MKVLISTYTHKSFKHFYLKFPTIFLKVVIGCFWVMISFCANGQSISDSITVKRTFGTVFQQHGKNLTPRMLLDITQSNPEAHNEMKLAKNNFDAGYALGLAGGALVGWPVGTALAGGDPNWTIAAVGAGLIVVSIPFSSAYVKRAKKAASIFNSQLKKLGFNRMDLKIGCTHHGIGLSLNF